MAVQSAWNLLEITATGTVFTNSNKTVEFGGAFLAVAGTSTTITAYDNTAASGSPIIPTTAALTVGQYVPPFGGLALNISAPANGVRLTTGLYITVGGTGSPKIYVLWR